MLVIGMDPGSRVFGLGVLRKEKDRILYVHSEEIELREKDIFPRMQGLWRRLEIIFQEYPPQSAAIEEGFMGKNVDAMNVLAQVRGVVMAACIHQGIPLTLYAPREIKRAVTGSGSAMKDQVIRMMQILLSLRDKSVSHDESDALATAYCHCLSLGSRTL